VYWAPGALTPEFRDALVRHKLDLLAVLWRLDAMRFHGVYHTRANMRPPIPIARLDARVRVPDHLEHRFRPMLNTVSDGL
jgi:hypothetical protein